MSSCFMSLKFSPMNLKKNSFLRTSSLVVLEIYYLSSQVKGNRSRWTRVAWEDAVFLGPSLQAIVNLG